MPNLDRINHFGEQRKFYSVQAELIFAESLDQAVAALVMEKSNLWRLYMRYSESTFPSRLEAIAYLEKEYPTDV